MISYEISKLPSQISDTLAVDLTYKEEIDQILTHLSQDRSILIQTPKQVVPFLMTILRKKLKTLGLSTTNIDGKAQDGQGIQGSRLQRMAAQFESAVNTYDPSLVFVVPYLDVLTSERGRGLSSDGKEILTLIHENPKLKLLGFEDPDLPLNSIVSQAFFTRVSCVGIERKDLISLITQEEARRFGVKNLPLLELHRLLSGQSPIQIRRIFQFILASPLPTQENDNQVEQNLKAIRQLTLSGDLQVSPINLDQDIAGYSRVKRIIKDEILTLYQRSREIENEEDVKELESLIPRGIILYGPPGTGKTLFARGIAEAINGTVLVVNGPELKSQWVGEGEANIRRLFAQARANAPSVIVFDEIDSLATKRSQDGSASEASRTMVNQLLTEMDGFRPDEMVFTIGTTNLPDLLDPALLRPGRFALQIEIPYPGLEDRKAILSLWNRKLKLGLANEDIDRLSSWTARPTKTGTPYAGDHLRALGQQLKRKQLRENIRSFTWDQIRAWLGSEFVTNESSQQVPELSLADVAGYAKLKMDLKDTILDILKKINLAATSGELEDIQSLEAILPKALLLHGPPGTGKTHFAQAMAGEIGARIELISAPEILSKWVGQGEENIRLLFSRAKSNPPTLIVLDEIDALAGTRNDNSSTAGRGILLQLMTELSTLKPYDRVFVVGITNRLADLDPALLRPGRFGSLWEVGYPEIRDYEEITEFFLKKFSLQLNKEQFESLVGYFQGYTSRGTPHSPDDLRHVLASLKREVVLHGTEIIQSAESLEQWLRHSSGQTSLAAPELRRVAIHESGHVLATALVGELNQINRVSLRPTQDALGFVEHNESRAPFMTETQMRNSIIISLGGRAAELLIFEEGSTGAHQDLQKATTMAKLMVGQMAMGSPESPMIFGDADPIDPVYEGLLMGRVQSILNEAQEFLDSKLPKYKTVLDDLSRELILKKSLDGKWISEWWKENGQ